MTNQSELDQYRAMLDHAEGGGQYLVVTACLAHGTKVAGDYNSARVYVGCALDEQGGGHSVPGFDPWVCCDQMVIDPRGIFDH
jgi:hypothetical protein